MNINLTMIAQALGQLKTYEQHLLQLVTDGRIDMATARVKIIHPELGGDALVDAIYQELAHDERQALPWYQGWIVDAAWNVPPFRADVEQLIRAHLANQLSATIASAAATVIGAQPAPQVKVGPIPMMAESWAAGKANVDCAPVQDPQYAAKAIAAERASVVS